MKPHLVLLSGPEAGAIFPLTGRFTLGRSSDNHLQLRDHAASRVHCAVDVTEGGVIVSDLGSRHGTFVNGLPATTRALAHGDRLSVAGTELLVLIGDESAPSTSAGANPCTFAAVSTVEEPAEALLAAHPARHLLALARELSALRSEERVTHRLLAAALEAVPADRAALHLTNPRGSELGATTFRDRRGGDRAFPLPEALLRHASMANTVTLLESDGGGGLLFTPLATGRESLGALIFVAPSPASFTPAVREAAAGLAALGALALAQARELAWLEAETDRLRRTLHPTRRPLGEHPAWVSALSRLERAAASPATVLITGESGTGKEVAARFVHQHSDRASRPFIAVNCAVLSAELLASELFGHERGAFTGALARRTGAFEAAHRGTLFLDEIGELAHPLQAKLLRALQEREIVRLGASEPFKVDVRVVAATNRDLGRAVAAGTFREDLFYRLNVIAVALPPLCERGEDVQLLASHFARELGDKLGRPRTGFTRAARACLARYPWPGNVRELGNAIERALVLGDGELIRAEDLPESICEAVGTAASESAPLPAFHQAVRAVKERLILDAIAAAGGNITRAAEALGLNANYLHRLITNLALRPRLSGLSEEREPPLSEG